MPATLVLYSRPGCEHCEQLEDQLHKLFRGRYRLDWRDVDRAGSARRRFGTLIPVLTDADGRILSTGVLEPMAVETYLASLESAMRPV